MGVVLRPFAMKKLFYLIFAVYFLAGCKDKEIEAFQGPPGPNEGDTSIYNADHYRLTKILHFSKSDSPEPGGYVEFTYDGAGNLTRQSNYDIPELLSTYKTYTYINGRKATEKVYAGPVNALTLANTTTYTYQGDLLTKEDVRNDVGTMLRSKHYVYANRKLIETYTWSESLGKHHHYKYTRDGRGNVVKMQAYMYDNELSSTENYTYDSQNRVIRTERFNHQNALETVIITEYTGNNTLPSAEISRNAAGNGLARTTYEFDVAGNQIRTLIGKNTLNRRKYYGRLLREEIRYAPTWGFTEAGMSRYEYEKK